MLRSIGVWLVFVVSMPIVLQAQYDPTAPEPQPPLRGKLFLHGGGPLDQPMREAFVKEAGGAQAKIVVIPTADVKDPLGAKKTRGMERVWCC